MKPGENYMYYTRPVTIIQYDNKRDRVEVIDTSDYKKKKKL